MRHRRAYGRSVAGLAMALAMWSTAPLAQEPRGPAGKPGTAPRFVVEALPDRLARRVYSQRRMLQQFALADPDKTPRGVVNALKIWSAGYPAIRVCFFSGSRQVRSRIAAIAMEWKRAVPGLPLDFGDVDDPRLCGQGEVNHIRIDFAPDGYWSLLGTDSVRLASQREPSMNLAGFDTAPPDEGEFRATVLHEFGHAIGLEHEHQSPLAKCDSEFDWPQIEAWLAGPPNFWSKATVRYNMGALNKPGLLATDFDRHSIMLYTFPASYFRLGEQSSCFSEPNTELSTGDKAIVKRLYPADGAERRAVASRIRAHHLALIRASGKAKGAKSAVLQLIDRYLPEGADETTPR